MLSLYVGVSLKRLSGDETHVLRCRNVLVRRVRPCDGDYLRRFLSIKANNENGEVGVFVTRLCYILATPLPSPSKKKNRFDRFRPIVTTRARRRVVSSQTPSCNENIFMTVFGPEIRILLQSENVIYQKVSPEGFPAQTKIS